MSERYGFEVEFSGEPGAGLLPYAESVEVWVDNEAGGDLGEFPEFLRGCLAEWFEGAAVSLAPPPRWERLTKEDPDGLAIASPQWIARRLRATMIATGLGLSDLVACPDCSGSLDLARLPADDEGNDGAPCLWRCDRCGRVEPEGAPRALGISPGPP